jgi:hypothetical protein
MRQENRKLFAAECAFFSLPCEFVAEPDPFHHADQVNSAAVSSMVRV